VPARRDCGWLSRGQCRPGRGSRSYRRDRRCLRCDRKCPTTESSHITGNRLRQTLPLAKGLGVLRFDNVRHQWLSYSDDTHDYRYVSHISWCAMMYHRSVHLLQDDHFLVLLIFPFRYCDLVEAKDQFYLHSLDLLPQVAYRFIRESTWHLECQVFWRAFMASVKSSRWQKMKESGHSRRIEWKYFALH
jgi:hypothetical protein